MIVDCAVYTNGRRRPGDLAVMDALDAATDPDSFVWIGLHEPSEEEFDAVRDELGLHPLAVEDAVRAHQRPKLDVYDDHVFVVLRPARYDDQGERLEVSEIQLFIGERYVVAVRHGQGHSLREVRLRLEQDPERMACGPMAVLHAVIDSVVDDYLVATEGLDNDMAEIEVAVFDPDRPRSFDPSGRIFRLKRQVLELHRISEALHEPLRRLAGELVPGTPPELASYFRDVEDHVTRVVGMVSALRVLLTDALEANLAIVTVRQNDDMRTMSAWLAIGGFPTVVGAVYGMNFQHMPELGWKYGYLIVMVAIAIVCAVLYQRFKRVGWL